MFKRIKELQSLVDSSRKSLEKAERKIEERNILIADMEKQANALYEENKDLRFENEEQKDIFKEIENLARTQQYGSVENLQNKLKSILMTAKSI